LYPYACDSLVYCVPVPGGLLHTVQMARLYTDSKTFVDKPLKYPEAEVLNNFTVMMEVRFGERKNKTFTTSSKIFLN
jgi:alpha,alpha-trehalase